MADLAAEINASVENIGARRTHTVLEKLLEEISFDRHRSFRRETFVVDCRLCPQTQVGALAKKGDLSRFDSLTSTAGASAEHRMRRRRPTTSWRAGFGDREHQRAE